MEKRGVIDENTPTADPPTETDKEKRAEAEEGRVFLDELTDAARTPPKPKKC